MTTVRIPWRFVVVVWIFEENAYHCTVMDIANVNPSSRMLLSLTTPRQRSTSIFAASVKLDSLHSPQLTLFAGSAAQGVGVFTFYDVFSHEADQTATTVVWVCVVVANVQVLPNRKTSGVHATQCSYVSLHAPHRKTRWCSARVIRPLLVFKVRPNPARIPSEWFMAMMCSFTQSPWELYVAAEAG